MPGWRHEWLNRATRANRLQRSPSGASLSWSKTSSKTVSSPVRSKRSVRRRARRARRPDRGQAVPRQTWPGRDLRSRGRGRSDHGFRRDCHPGWLRARQDATATLDGGSRSRRHGCGQAGRGDLHGPQLLISANALRDRTVTCWPSIAVDVKNAGGLYVDQPVAQDGNLITSRKPDDVPLFSEALIRALSRIEAAPV